MDRPARLPLAALLLTTAVLLGGCTTGGSDESAAGAAAPDSTSDTAAQSAEAPPLGGAAATPAEGSAVGAPVLGSVDPTGTEVIRIGQLAVLVEDVRAAADRATQLARDAGGVVAFEQADADIGRQGTDEGGRAELRLRVPPERFDDVLSGLAELGEERGRSLGAEDVTDQVVDLESRLATQRASVERVRALLDEAQNLGEVVQIEGELTRRTADLESLQARLESLRAQVDLSTITLSLYTERGAPQAATGFGDGLRGGWDALLASARVLAVVSGALLPFVPLLLLAAFVTVRLRSRGRAADAA